ncbi:MAG: ferrochelatase, partial [Inquilinus sp.]|nr:ferrochelatase [Inquilinus sp.]
MGEAQSAGESRIAVVLLNLGGPDRPKSVRPFLFNLFNDKSIIRVPQPFRYLLARIISRRRAVEAEKIYAELGGGSPILPNTEAQAAALTEKLGDLGKV